MNVRSDQDLYIQDFYKNPSFENPPQKSKYSLNHSSSNDYFKGDR